MVDMVRAGMACDWCSGRNDDYPMALCITHCAEHDGVSVAEYDRMAEAEAYDRM